MQNTNTIVGYYLGTTHKVGDHVELGRFGGAYLTRVVAVVDGRADLVRLASRSVRNTDGTFSTEYTDAV